MMTTDDEMFAAEIRAKFARERAEFERQQRVKRDMKHLDWVNRRDHPAMADPTPAEIAERHRLADESLRRDAERLAANEARWQREEAAREAAAKARPRMQVPGNEGFTIKRGV
jgi:hypothetical protein